MNTEKHQHRETNEILQAIKKFHDELVSLVGIILELNKRIQSAKGSEKEQIQRQIEKIDKEIDEIVYKLYEITEEEKKIIEEG